MEMKLSLYEVIIFTWYTTGQSKQCWKMIFLFNQEICGQVQKYSRMLITEK